MRPSLRHLGYAAAWSAIAFVLCFLLLFVLPQFGGCGSSDQPCRDSSTEIAQFVLLVVAVIYGVGLGMIFDRWLLDRNKE